MQLICRLPDATATDNCSVLQLGFWAICLALGRCCGSDATMLSSAVLGGDEEAVVGCVLEASMLAADAAMDSKAELVKQGCMLRPKSQRKAVLTWLS